MKANIFSISKQAAKQALYISILALGFTSASTAQVQKLPTGLAKINNKSVFIEIAATEASRNYGLMHRTSLDKDSGMLFVFEEVDMPCFWMKNTLIPLSIAFIDDKGHITDIKDMQPNTTTGHCPSRAVKYALELNQGWYDKNHIKTGDQVCVDSKKQHKNKYPAKELGIEIYCK